MQSVESSLPNWEQTCENRGLFFQARIQAFGTLGHFWVVIVATEAINGSDKIKTYPRSVSHSHPTKPDPTPS